MKRTKEQKRSTQESCSERISSSHEIWHIESTRRMSFKALTSVNIVAGGAGRGQCKIFAE